MSRPHPTLPGRAFERHALAELEERMADVPGRVLMEIGAEP